MTKQEWRTKFEAALVKMVEGTTSQDADAMVDCLVEWEAFDATSKNDARATIETMLDETFARFEQTMIDLTKIEENQRAIQTLAVLHVVITFVHDESLLKKIYRQEQSLFSLTSLLTLDPKKTTPQ